MQSSDPLEHVRAMLRDDVPHLDDDREFAPDIATAVSLVRSGRLTKAVGSIAMPGV
jgi:histidine ammonia-lyase